MNKTIQKKSEKWFTAEEIYLLEKIDNCYTIPSSFSKKQLRTLLSIPDIDKFNRYQYEEIIKGIKDELDVSVYVNLEFSWKQMKQIRLGLKKRIATYFYAKSELNYAQMSSIYFLLLLFEELKERNFYE